MAASRAVRTSLDLSALSRSCAFLCSSVDWRGTILTAACNLVSTCIYDVLQINAYLFTRLLVLGQLDFTHATRTDCLA